MADNVTFQTTTLATPPNATVVATDDVGGVQFQRVKLDIGADGASSPVVSGNPLPVTGTATVVQPTGTNLHTVVDSGTITTVSAVTTITNALPAGTNNIGDVDVLTVPADPFGVNADAASATGSISAKLRFIASTGIPVTGSVAVTNAGTFAVQDAAAEASLSVLDDWDESDRAKVNLIVGQAGIAGGTGTDGATVPRVTLATNVALPAGTNAIGKLAANSGVDIGDVDVTSIVMPTGASAAQVQGTVAHDSADAQNPVKIGAKAIAFGANPTGVTAGDRTDLYASRAGIPWVLGGHPNVITTEYLWTSAQTDDAIVTVATGNKIVVTQIQVTIDEATTVGVGLRIGFATATLPTPPTDGNAVAGYLVSHRGLVPGSGLSRGDGSGILGVGADDEDLRITCEAPTSGSASAVISYFTVES